MVDTGQNIEVPDEMSIADAEALQKDTENRFMWEFTNNDNYILCRWRNYYKTAGGNRSKDENGAFKLLEIETKSVRVI